MPTMVPTASGTAFAQGVDASKPAASSGNSGYYYFSTDVNGGTLYQSTGSSWVQITTGVTAVKPNGLTGATAASRYAGSTTSGSPASGTFAVGDFVIDHTGVLWICTVAGTPGTWVSASGAGVTSITGTSHQVIASASTGAVTLSTPQSIDTTSSPTFASIAAGGLTGATAASRHAGGTASGAPASGTFSVGDFIVDQTGKLWVCTSAGTPGTWVAVGGSSGAMTNLADTVIAGTTTTTVSWTSISGSYTSLRFYITARCDEVTTDDYPVIRFNADSGANYEAQFTNINNTTVSDAHFTGQTDLGHILEVPGTTGVATVPGAWVVDIPHYVDTTFYKTAHARGLFEPSSAAPRSGIGDGLWKNTAAITQIDIIAPASGHWVAGSHFRLFGIA